MFSVVIPLFDKRPWIQRALDSVYAQSIEQAAIPEIIVVNDGSTDGGEAVAKAQADPRVRVIDQPNRGVSAARNAGIAAATQPFVAFLDADDRWRPEFLARMRELIERHPGATLYGAGFATIRDGREIRRYGVSGVRGGPVDFFRESARGFVIHPSSMVAPREALDRIGGFPEGVTHAEDFLVWAKLALAGSVVLTPEPLAEYDVGVPGQAVTYWQKGYRERFEILAYHRFLAGELRRRGGQRRMAGSADAAGPAANSFTPYAVGQLETAALQRLYWGNFTALATFVQDLALDSLPLGWQGRLACWIARHRITWPFVATMMAVVRLGRETLKLSCRAVA